MRRLTRLTRTQRRLLFPQPPSTCTSTTIVLISNGIYHHSPQKSLQKNLQSNPWFIPVSEEKRTNFPRRQSLENFPKFHPSHHPDKLVPPPPPGSDSRPPTGEEISAGQPRRQSNHPTGTSCQGLPEVASQPRRVHSGYIVSTYHTRIGSRSTYIFARTQQRKNARVGETTQSHQQTTIPLKVESSRTDHIKKTKGTPPHHRQEISSFWGRGRCHQQRTCQKHTTQDNIIFPSRASATD